MIAVTAIAGCTGGASSMPAMQAAPGQHVADSVARDARASRLVTETPLAADTLADSVGINGGTRSETTPEQWVTIQRDLSILGVRHLRSPILIHRTGFAAQLVKFLTAMNGKLDGLTDCPGIQFYSNSATSPKDIQDFDAEIGNRMESVEGPNEVDDRNDKNWAADTVKCLPNLRRGEPDLPFIAPSLADPLDNAPTLGNISASVDYGNIHRYYGGHNPGTQGGNMVACGNYGSLEFSLCEAGINSGSKPAIITESGYNTRSEVDEATQAKYLSRMFLVDLKAGVVRTYVYTFTDYLPSDGFGYDGLLRADLTRKPAFEAVAREIAYFSDPGTPTTLEPLSYDVAGGTPTSDHLLFQRHNGTYVLALWDETASWDPEKMHAITVRPRMLTVDLPFTPSAAKAVSMNDAGILVDTAVSTSTGKVLLPVDDHVTFLSFRKP